MTDPRRSLPGVDSLLASPAFRGLLERFPRGRVVEAARQVLSRFRRDMEGSSTAEKAPTAEEISVGAEVLLSRWEIPSLRPVINATGVTLHTNLGRAPLSYPALEAMVRAGSGYSNLEFDLEGGSRGSRYIHCVQLLRELTGAPDALVVNNNAAAVVLAVNTVARGKQVLVSRGELVEIGGGFRIPDMLSGSGALLREVGTTNKTRPEDYREAAEEGNAAAILKVHRSNFRMVGFTQEASLAELVEIAGSLGLFLIHDLGSGLLLDATRVNLPPEPRAVDSLGAGVDVVAVSGDKLLGGPQAGILLGSEEALGRMRKNPLCRAFRVDKVTLAGLEATLRHYLDPDEAVREIPVLRALTTPLKELETRTRALAAQLDPGDGEIWAEEGKGVVGGGTMPEVELPTWVLRIRSPGLSAEDLSRALRAGEPPVVCRREDDTVVLDLRTVIESEEVDLLRRLREALGGER
jgi:L-seryl-tRNA(Ser) seleniumtransferase